jgi:acetoacetyl-CoA reductase/3-oxoacyl-[acyl-carrier protein] reductase
MLERGSGRIINISSVTGETGNIGQANYTVEPGLGLTKTPREVAFALRRPGSSTPGWGSRSTPPPPGPD